VHDEVSRGCRCRKLDAPIVRRDKSACRYRDQLSRAQKHLSINWGSDSPRKWRVRQPSRQPRTRPKSGLAASARTWCPSDQHRPMSQAVAVVWQPCLSAGVGATRSVRYHALIDTEHESVRASRLSASLATAFDRLPDTAPASGRSRRSRSRCSGCGLAPGTARGGSGGSEGDPDWCGLNSVRRERRGGLRFIDPANPAAWAADAGEALLQMATPEKGRH
jgi:hypothetical protein